MDLREVATALYAVPSADFVAERSAAAAGADADLAKRIRALRKPTAAAAAVNALVRDDPDLIDAVLDVGDRMRAAFAARDRAAIRDLTRERQRLLQRALRGVDAGASVQREVEDTLQAAVIDPAAAAAVRSGLLVRPLESTGVEDLDLSEALALPPGDLPPRPARTAAAAIAREPEVEPQPSASERREHERRIRAAEKSLARAKADAEALDDELDDAVDRRGDREAEVDTLERRLRRAEEELSESKAAERELRRRITEAHNAVRLAEKALRDVTET